jgi:glycosyltransferase involved in cell wall biosynthesis
MPKLVRITTTPIFLNVILKGQMKFIKENGFEVTMISSYGNEVKSVVERESCPHIVVNFTRKITPFADLIALIKLFFILKKIKPEIVHTETPKAGLIGLWAAKLSGVPVRIHTIAGLPWMEYNGIVRKILMLMEKLTAMAASKIYPNSFVQKDFLFQNHIGRKKMQVLGNGSSNGIDIHHFSLTQELIDKATELKRNTCLKENAHIWIFIGRVVKDKGVTELTEAFMDLLSYYPDDQLWIVGEEEPELDPLDEKYIDILKSHPSIKCWGFRQDVRPFLVAANTLVFPSYREGFPNVPLEAACLECALILSDINGCNEIVQNGKDGLLIPPKNTQALLDAMLYLRENPATTEKLITSAKEKVIKNYDRKIIWNLLLAEYKKLISEKK